MESELLFNIALTPNRPTDMSILDIDILLDEVELILVLPLISLLLLEVVVEGVDDDDDDDDNDDDVVVIVYVVVTTRAIVYDVDASS